MNNFHDPKENLYDSKIVGSLIKNPTIRKTPPSEFFKEDTAPLPIIPAIPKGSMYPPTWDEPKWRKLPSLNKMLSNYYYVLVCMIFTSIIVIIALVKAVWLFATK